MTGFRLRLPVVAVLVAALACVFGFFYLWGRAGGHVPWHRDYLVSFETKDVKNLQEAGDVREAGVLVGKVYHLSLDGTTAHVTLAIDSPEVPVHQGAKVRIGLKSVIGESYVDLTDGDGKALPNGSDLPAAAVTKPVDIDEVISTFTPSTRKALAHALTSAGIVTAGTQSSFSDLMDAASILGREGYTATDALAAQSKDITAVVRETTQILASLNTNRTALTSMIVNAHRLTSATAGQQANLARTVRDLPALMTSARSATASLGDLSTDLTPVANNLDAAAPGLNSALTQLPSVSHSLRALLPYMNSSLTRAHQTLVKVPALSTNISAVSPQVDTLLLNLNPMLSYIQPYANDVGSFFGNFGGAFDIPLENGIAPARLAPIFDPFSLRGNPLNLQSINAQNWNNPYPSPLKANQPSKYTGTYTRVAKEKE